MNYENKYLKYKFKYLKLQNNNMNGGSTKNRDINKKLVDNINNYLYYHNDPVDFSLISDPIINIKLTKNFIFINYPDFVVCIYFEISCCEASWFELFKPKKIIEHTDKNKYFEDERIKYNTLNEYYITNDIENIEKINKEFDESILYHTVMDNNIFIYKKNKKNELTKRKQLIGKQINEISFCGNINLPHSNRNDYDYDDRHVYHVYDQNQVYKITTKDNKYFYFVLRTASNGDYTANALASKIPNKKYNQLFKKYNDLIKKYNDFV